MNDVLRDAYSALRFVTPLPHGMDCGKLCSARCCHGSDSDGMELFWGEERLFSNDPNYTVRTDGVRKLLICRGTCVRRMRPLACRMYPLYPVPQETEHGLSVHVVYDLRGLQTCPMVHRHIRPDPRFAAAVRRAGLLLLREPHNMQIMRETAALFEDLMDFSETFKEECV